MKIFITGATGFLGKHVLSRLVADERVSKIWVLTRRKSTHPSPKVSVCNADLSDLGSLERLPNETPDVVLHLAGLYTFAAPFRELYMHNVLGTGNLLGWIKRTATTKLPLVVTASSYAVGLGQRGSFSGEEPLSTMPDRANAYAHCKAIAEGAVIDSGLPYRVLRLGILVGQSGTGAIEKIDGPYHLCKFLRALSPLAKLPAFPLPIPADRDCVLPLIPVDIAAQACIDAMFARADDGSELPIFGVYNEASVKAGEIAEECAKRYLPRARLSFLGKLPAPLLSLQSHLTGIPALVFDFSSERVPLSSVRFRTAFPGLEIPHFSTYRESFFRGFEEYLKGEKA